MDGQLILGVLGTLAGLVYAGLGIAALKHLRQASGTDRTVGWTLWWFTESDRYDEEGQRLCRIGGVVLLFGVASWVGAFVVGN
jgi:hypothetical protein